MADERPFIKVSDTFADHPKFIALDDDAAGFMVVAMWGYCRHQNTDGLIPKAKAHRLTKSATPARCQKAIRVGLLEDAGDYYRCHDYLDHQQSAAQRQARSEQAKQAGRAGGLAKGKRSAKQTATETLSDPASGIEAEVEVEVEVEQQKTSSSVSRAVKHRIREDWLPTADDLAWAAVKAPLVNLVRETESFRNYFLDKGEKRPGWSRSWQTWMLRAQTNAEVRPLHPGRKPVGSGIGSQPDEAYLAGGLFSDAMRRRKEREAQEQGESA